jgi:dTMP kinase
MNQAAAEPRFIVLDGIDGTGKTTQTAALADYLKKRGIQALATLEPGATVAGRLIRQILLNKETKLSKEAELLLFCADRAEHQHKIIDTLAVGAWVISDRFLSSSWAYQVWARGAPEALLREITSYTVKRFPDLTIILDLDEAGALTRSRSRLAAEEKQTAEGRFEDEKLAFFSRVRQGFIQFAAHPPYGGDVVIIDASKSETETAAEIARFVSEKFLD